MKPASPPLPPIAMAVTSSSPPKLSLHQLSLYNTGRMTSEQVMAAFVARQPLLERLMADIAEEKEKSRPQHHLIVGQRGMGKTMLLARIAAGLRMDEALRQRFIPLVFAEEQYAVDRLSKFWLNCLDSLADSREVAQDQAAVEKIDATVARLNKSAMRPAKDDQPFADEVYRAFEEAAQASGQRPVLLVDNLQLVFERLEERQQHSLRELLMRSGAPVLVGASPSPPTASQDYGAAFYDHFKIHYLTPLSEEEMRDLMVRLADAAERADVRRRVLDHPQRLKVLRQLTGGNPRTTLTLFFLYAEDFAPKVFGDLEGLLDRVTPLYKARFEELTDQQQVITSAVASHWDPVTMAKLAEVTVLPPATLSAQIDRLEKTGTLERVELFGESRNGYQIAERFFNIWFLMRSASRRQRREVEFLTRFLENFYEPGDRVRIARHLMSEDSLSPDGYLWRCALEASLTEPDIAAALRRHTELLSVRAKKTCEAHSRLHELIDLNALPPATLAFEDMRQKLIELIPQLSLMEATSFAEKILGDRHMFISDGRERLALLDGKFSLSDLEEILAILKRLNEIDMEEYSEYAVQWFSQLLISGQLRNKEDIEDWNRAFKQADNRIVCQLMIETIPEKLGGRLSNEAVQNIRQKMEPSEKSSANDWCRWGYGLHYHLLSYSEAERAYRKTIAIEPNSHTAWFNLGCLLAEKLERYVEAEGAFLEAARIDPKDADTAFNLGSSLACLHKYQEAEMAFRKAIELEPKDADPWRSLGNVLSLGLQRHQEAENAYRKSLSLKPSAASWRNLGDVLAMHLGRYNEAKKAYEEAVILDPEDARSWHNLGGILMTHLSQYEEAEKAYNRAIAIEPTADSWFSLGNLLALRLHRKEDAEKAYRNAISINKEHVNSWHNLGATLEGLCQYENAAQAYRKAVSIDSETSSWQALIHVLTKHLRRYSEAEKACRKAISDDPQCSTRWRILAELLHEHFHDHKEAENAYRQAVNLDPNDAENWNGLGNLIGDTLGRLEEAVDAFDHALMINPQDECVLQNRLFIHRDFLGNGMFSHPLFSDILALPAVENCDVNFLHEALFAAYQENWGLARQALAKAAEMCKDGFPENTTEDWLRASAVLIHLNYGQALIEFVEGLGDTAARLRPWIEAVRAAQIGDKRALQNVAPEVRTAAEILYDGIDLRLTKLPEKTRRRPLPAAPKAKSKRPRKR